MRGARPAGGRDRARIRLTSRKWDEVQRRVAPAARACAYDRVGLGLRDERPPGATQTRAQDLRRLLGRARVRGPYVLVGHSLGGVYAPAFAATYPRAVAGLVLVDAVEADAIGEGLFDEGGSPVDAGALRRAIDHRGRLDLPVAVLERGSARNAAWRAAQRRLARRAGDSLLAVVPGAGHGIHGSRPDVVARAVRAVLHAAERGTRLQPCERAFRRLDVRCPPVRRPATS